MKKYISRIIMSFVVCASLVIGLMWSAVPVRAADDVLKTDMSAWSYDSSSGIYYQTGISYCKTPADISYETLSIAVPASYFRIPPRNW